MIIDKSPLQGDDLDPDIQDAPPSYDALVDVPPRPTLQDDKVAGPSTSTSSTPPVSPNYPASISAQGKASGKRPSTWWNWPSGRAVREVRTTLLGLLRDLVKQTDSHGALGVLESCSDACNNYDISLSSLLQEKSIEGHTPLYWAIINRPTIPLGPNDPDLVMAILSHAAPITDDTVDEIRLACLHTCDHVLFQRLRYSPAFSPLSGRDELIAGGTLPIDDVDVEDVKTDESAFIVKFRFPLFQKRMRVSEGIRLEFIAKGRLWELSFIVSRGHDKRLGYRHFKEGSWVIKVALLPHSPPTWFDSRLVIEDPRAKGASHADTPTTPGSLIEAVMSQIDTSDSSKVKPPIEIRLNSREQISAPRSSSSWDSTTILLAMGENTQANSLQFNGCPYIESDGSLTARLEAKLGRPARSR